MGNHQALLVTLGEQRYLIDVGNGAPHFDPIPVGQPVEVRHAGLAYRFRPGDEPGSYLQERLLGGEWSPFCRYELRDQAAAEVDAAYRRHHIPRANARWMGHQLAQLSPQQIRDAFRAGGYSAPEVEELSGVVEKRIAELQKM